jgi:predicted DNA-binding transcriptional regulator AlpA
MENTRQTTQDECWTLTVPVAGKRLGLSRGASYDAANRGDLPGLIRIGRRLMVSKVALERALENGWRPPDKS